ncbi:hypothetical protein GCM10007036_23350 [Alsobacter metallidurans]|uniref:Uncharacterized protein n=1 Tax=Alsobacter metallidurans TaxID=340221 RepID=A0A917I6N0_9HYPH|nr:hypothetical protein [Alsobacter metallidurans]GGH20048.1 hypothetical protein GCM10007036_23350 [Alsobacter metallidurans]
MGNAWRGVLRSWAITTVAAASGAALLILCVDPYDTGRVPGVGLGFTREQAPRAAHASRARDPAFDAAIIGNSHAQLFSPARLDAATGAKFMSLAIPGSGLPEQKAVLAYFLRHRREPAKAIVIGLDEYACRSGPNARNRLQGGPFPFWLYAADFWTYARGAFRADVLEDAVAALLGTEHPAVLAGRDGYWNYEIGRRWRGPDLEGAGPLPLAEQPGPFPGLAVLRDMLDAIPPTTSVALVVTPVYAKFRPRPGRPAARAETACKDAIAAAASRSNVTLLDFRRDTRLTRDPRSFWDGSHLTQAAAELIEAAIAQALKRPAS